jgi:peptidoglycan hydrolase-like protein with peptidoglycan-binding domain
MIYSFWKGKKMGIQASVGNDGANRRTDVESIQQLLNAVPAASGGADPDLKVDGICGPKTKAAILNFQLRQFGNRLADGKVDPDGPTMSKLNELAGRGGDPAHGEVLKALDDFIDSARNHPISLNSLEHGHWKHKAERLKKLLDSYSHKQGDKTGIA